MKKISQGFSFVITLAVLVSCCLSLLLLPPSVKVVSASPGPDVKILRPNGDGTYSDFEDLVGASTHWEAVDEEVADDVTTHVGSDVAGRRDTFALTDSGIPAGSIINKIVVHVRARREGPRDDDWYIIIRSGTTDALSDVIASTNSWVDYEYTWTTDPNTGEAWTISAIDALEAGGKVDTGCDITQVYVEVYYTLPPPLEITTTSLPDGTVGVAYSQTLAATGGTTPYTWSRVGGSLPGGLSLSEGGVISGTPTAEGDFNFTVKVTDANSQTDTQALSIHVGVISLFNFSVSASPDNLTFRQGENASSTISVSLISGTTEMVSLHGTWMGTAPMGISYDFSPQSGTPTSDTPFTSTLTFTASSDANGGTFIFEVTGSGGGLTRTDTITLMLPPAAPSLVSPADGAAIETNTPTFDWDDVAGAVSYTLQVATDDNFSYTVFSTDVVESTKTSPVSLSYGTRHYWRIRAKNDVGTGDWSSTWSFTAKLTAPKVLSFQIEAGGQYTNSTNVELTISARNAVEMSFSSDGVMWGEWEPYQTLKSYTLEAPDGSKNVYIKVRDNVGDIGQMTLDSIILDQTPPSTTHSLSGDLGAEGYKGSVVVTLASTDAYGVESTNYRIDNDEWRTGHTFVVSSDGKHTIGYYSTDEAGNEGEIKSLQVTVYTPTILPPILIKYWWAFLGTIVAVGVASVFVTRKVRLSGRLKRIGKEKREIIKLMKEAETKYYKEGSITRDAFDELMRGHEKRAAELEKEERILKAKVKKVKGKQVGKKRKRRR